MYYSTIELLIEARITINIYYYYAFRHQDREKIHLIYKGVIQSLTKEAIERP